MRADCNVAAASVLIGHVSAWLMLAWAHVGVELERQHPLDHRPVDVVPGRGEELEAPHQLLAAALLLVIPRLDFTSGC